MTLLLHRDEVEVMRPSRTLDAHGWAEDGPEQAVGRLRASVQPSQTRGDSKASDGGGAGPHDPAQDRRFTVYLTGPVDAGDVLVWGGVRLLVATLRYSPDPRGTGDLDCWVAECIDVTTALPAQLAALRRTYDTGTYGTGGYQP